jgi:aspartyl-tRNA(Asn)/glutamyl-tRNA(Gln) amidotransferase subunit A
VVPYELLLRLTLTVSAFALHEKVGGRHVRPAQWPSFTDPINMTGQPAASAVPPLEVRAQHGSAALLTSGQRQPPQDGAPAGFSDDGLPVGLQIVGRLRDDAMALRASTALEAASP